MNKTMKRALAVLLAALMLVSVLAACGGDSGSSTPSSEAGSSSEASSEDASSEESGDDASEPEEEETGAWAPPSIESEDYDEVSEYYYNYTLGEFYEAYKEATSEVLDVNKRYAMEAVGEAKLLEAGVMQPTTAIGGQYAIGRIAPGSTTTNG